LISARSDERYDRVVDPFLLSPWHIAFLAVVVLLLFGPKRLPEMGRSLGKGLREFKQAITGEDEAPGLPTTSRQTAPRKQQRDTID